MIHLTDKAAAKIEEISNEEGIGHYTIRVRIVGGGCSGMTHDMFFDDQISEMDEVSDFDGTKIVIDPLSFQYLENVTIDYVDGPISSGFKFSSPDIKATCGCGQSVSY